MTQAFRKEVDTSFQNKTNVFNHFCLFIVKLVIEPNDYLIAKWPAAQMECNYFNKHKLQNLPM